MHLLEQDCMILLVTLFIHVKDIKNVITWALISSVAAASLSRVRDVFQTSLIEKKPSSIVHVKDNKCQAIENRAPKWSHKVRKNASLILAKISRNWTRSAQ